MTNHLDSGDDGDDRVQTATLTQAEYRHKLHPELATTLTPDDDTTGGGSSTGDNGSSAIHRAADKVFAQLPSITGDGGGKSSDGYKSTATQSPTGTVRSRSRKI